MTADRQEFELINWIRRQVRPHDRLSLGIGDDTAALSFDKPSSCLITTDMLMEGVHFTMPPATAFQVGQKALAVNLSDIAAMAGLPLAAAVSLALPRGFGEQLAEELYAGLTNLAEKFGVAIAGGDTNSWEGPLVINVTLLGEAAGRGPVLRSGALPGDWIFVTGELGGSLAGKHLDFTPRVTEASLLHREAALHAMIDISDGLAADLRHITGESRVGAILEEAAIPISAPARACGDGRSPLEHALGDGEDFELLFTVSPEEGRRLLAEPPFDLPLSQVGRIVEGAELQIQTAAGPLEPLPDVGWKHAL